MVWQPIGADSSTGALPPLVMTRLQEVFSSGTGGSGTAATITGATAITGEPGTNASVSMGGTDTARTFTFTIPRGAKGDKGDAGTAGTSATITGATASTGLPGSNVSISVGGSNSARTFAFTIPRGDKGDKGDVGNTGTSATITSASASTGLPGSNASVTLGGSETARTFAFTVPRGDKGDKGDKGDTGQAGTGIQITGSVATASELQSVANPVAGDAYIANDTGLLHVYSGSAWGAGVQFRGPKGDTGATPTVGVGTVSTGNAGSSVLITEAGTATARTFNFTIPRGDKGDKGDQGNEGPPAATTIDFKPGTDLPSTYPTGISIMEVGQTATGWPSSFGVVETVRFGVNRSYQTFVIRTSGKSYRRTPDANDTGWLSWIEWGAQGEAGINATITGATAQTLAAGAPATVEVNGSETARSFVFGIPTGPAGANGTRGATWYVSGQGTVTTATSSVTGMVEGDIHLNATTAAISRYNGTAWVSAGSIRGATGTRGATWYIAGQGTVTAATSSVTGMLTGDVHLDPATGAISRYSGSAWVAAGNIQGPKGDTGTNGTSATITGVTATTLTAGSPATIEMGGSETARTFAFGIPAGPKGDKGDSGDGSAFDDSHLVPRTGSRPVGQEEIVFNVKDMGVIGDGVTDDTATIQAAIDAGTLAGGRTLFFPAGTYRITNLILKTGVILMGAQPAYGYGPNSRGSTHIRAMSGTTGIMIDGTGSNLGVVGLNIFGGANPTGTLGATTGIRSSGSWCRFSDLHFDMFRGPALQTVGTGYADIIDNILAINCCLDRTATSDVGVMDINGPDHYITRVESSASLSTGVSSTNLYINAWVIRGTNIFISNCVGEFADRGYLVLGSKNRFTGARGDRNFGPGYEIRGGSNSLTAAMSVDNNRGLNDVYPAFKTTGTGNTFIGCVVTSIAGERPSFAFEDTVNTSQPESRNSYYGCRGIGVQGAFSGHPYLGSSFEVPNHAMRVSSGTTIPVDQSGFQVLLHATAETITDFTGGHSGQTITILAINNNITIAHNSTIKWPDLKARKLKSNIVYRFTKYNGVWYPVSPEIEPVLVSPNGTSYRLSITDDGSLTTTTI